jgi:Co/Zn/Cd efflux system component
LRARSALIQGVFLGAIGIGVLAFTIYRTHVLQTPEAGLMGVFCIGALLINVIAVILLLPHRKGDANVCAVWLFSRNDVLGKLMAFGDTVFLRCIT